MAILQQPVVGGNVFEDEIGDDLAPAGTFMAMVIDIRDEFGVQRTKFQSTETEMVDLTTFLFGFRDAQGFEHRVASRRMKISGNEKAALFAFLKSLLGHAPQYGWDYVELRGAHCLLTVEHIQRRDGTGVFVAIAALSPVPQGMGGNGGMAQPFDNAQGRPFGGAQGGPAGGGGVQGSGGSPPPRPSPLRGEGGQGAGGNGGMSGSARGMGNGAQAAGNGSEQPRPPGARPAVASGGAMAGRPVGPAPVRSFGGAQGGQAARPFDNAQGRPIAPSPAPLNDPLPF